MPQLPFNGRLLKAARVERGWDIRTARFTLIKTREIEYTERQFIEWETNKRVPNRATESVLEDLYSKPRGYFRNKTSGPGSNSGVSANV